MMRHFAEPQFSFVYRFVFIFKIILTSKSLKMLGQQILNVVKDWDWVFAQRIPV